MRQKLLKSKIKVVERNIILYGFYNNSGTYSILNVMQYEGKCSKRFLVFRLEQHATMNLALIPFMRRKKSGRGLFISRSILWNVPSQLGKGRLH